MRISSYIMILISSLYNDNIKLNDDTYIKRNSFQNLWDFYHFYHFTQERIYMIQVGKNGKNPINFKNYFD